MTHLNRQTPEEWGSYKDSPRAKALVKNRRKNKYFISKEKLKACGVGTEGKFIWEGSSGSSYFQRTCPLGNSVQEKLLATKRIGREWREYVKQLERAL